ncbi:v-type proton atpase subunit c 1 [Limosa lapponica baueri]|uniref:V-type proton ATPase subunit C n=1 Tax=Limosa lapponica baueri TaxID=1758121 RepID=A0A2I0TYT9_LIMLA|nr:v-type proton atpase subunit c 1 [Limosa lapponica baueri]
MPESEGKLYHLCQSLVYMPSTYQRTDNSIYICGYPFMTVSFNECESETIEIGKIANSDEAELCYVKFYSIVHYKKVLGIEVGTLDVLVGLSDELAKLDAFVESFTQISFQELCCDIEGVNQIDNDLKARASAYNNLKGNLQNLERKNAGSLLTRSLADIVKKEDFVLDSEYLVTLLVIVPNVLFEDQDSYLCNVTLFRKAVDDFKHKAREYKFMVRDFQYNEEEMKADKEEMNRLSTDKKKQFATVDIPGLNLSQQEYYPYVYYKIDCNLLEFK